MQIKIIATPSGEAPLWVRQAWIGLELPLQRPGLHDVQGLGVFAARSALRRLGYRLGLLRPVAMKGYIVNSSIAISLLLEHNESAAIWWKTHLPQYLDIGQNFVFDAPACEIQAANT
ncbi:MAG: hypothetical protein CFE33_08955 [Pseudorhodobacter sp. PARRP1]|nr:MAG: hypothetical protein CFE33_08955 [Pseudorhodobacter sp. PARRP1]